MKILLLSVFLFVAVSNVQETSAATDKVVCYYGSWATYRDGNGQFHVEHIDPRFCTNLIYTFVGLSDDGTVRILDPYNDLEENWGEGAFKRFINLKTRNPNAKVSLAIGGWNEGSTTYSNVMNNDALRAKFIQSALELVQKHGFDGFDLDWEYPNQRGGAEYDVENFSTLLKEMSAAFTPHGLILSAAVAAAEFSASQSYDIPSLSKYLDFINVMTYDLHGPWDKVTGLNAPLYASSKDVSEQDKQLNVDACIKYWIKMGADPAKLILGMATYGRTFTLNDASNNGLKAPADNPGNPGPYTNEPGMMGYNEILELQNQGGWTVVWEEEQLAPYMYKENQWIGYDDTKSLKIKTEYAKNMGLGGAMIWSLETDDFHGLSGTKFALLDAINKALGNNITPEPILTTTEGNTEPICKTEGFVRDPIDCAKFYSCVPLAGGGFDQVEFNCSPGLVFDPVAQTCNYPDQVQC